MIYVHVPFCRSFCSYCGFYSELCAGREDMMQSYTDAVCREVASRADGFRDCNSPDTIYIGGGTPSVLPLSALRRIKESLIAAGLSSEHPCEFTVEVNPDDILHEGYAEGLKALGVTRVSMGVQSFDDRLLALMNRRHSASDAIAAFGKLREAGFDNISIDLIFGIGEFALDNGSVQGLKPDMALWEESVETALSLRPEHISAYQLSVEPGSILEKLSSDGRFVAASDDFCAAQYSLLCRRLKSASYIHYEVSNFAQPGHEAVHNSAYWRHTPYLGLGPAAHSLFIDGNGCMTRSWNPSDLAVYIKSWQGAGEVEGGMKTIPNIGEETAVGVGSEVLDNEQIRIEDIMLGLRTSKGIARGLVPPSVAEAQMSSGNLVREGDRIRIPEDRLFVSDAIIAELI